MPNPSVDGFVEAVRQYRLLEPARLDVLVRDLRPRFTEVRALAKELLNRGWLTGFQVNQLLQNNGRDLLLDPYVILDRLGAGGTGVVFKARHLHMQRTVALKVIRKELLTDSEVIQRFYREVEAVSKVSHPNVVHAYDAGPIGNMHVLAMEYVEGVDLARLVKDSGPLPVAQACEHIRQAALGLQHIHECGLVHRDIKPSNLLLSAVGHPPSASGPAEQPKAESLQPKAVVKILDLGLARLLPRGRQVPDNPLTDPGSMTLGTTDYLAPEQALDMHGADIRADIYSLGCTFYFLLTGQPPFAGGTLAEKLMRHQQAEPPPIAKLRPGVPPVLEKIVRRLLAKRADDRYQTPAELARDLAEFGKKDRGRTAARRRLLLVGGLALVLLVGVLASALALSGGRNPTGGPTSLAGRAATTRDSKLPTAPSGVRLPGATSTTTAPPADSKLTRVIQGRPAVRDALIDFGSADRKYGAEPKGNPLRRSEQCNAFLVRFDLAPLGLSKEARLEKAVFSFYVWDPHNMSITKVCAFPLKTAWDEASVTWNQAAEGKPWAGGKSFAFNLDTGPPSPHVIVKPDAPGTDTVDPPLEYQLDATTIVQSWLDGSQPNHGLALAGVIDRAVDNGYHSRFQIYASEHPRPQYTPKLAIQLKP
jgi:serine/threonine-protein kinase